MLVLLPPSEGKAAGGASGSVGAARGPRCAVAAGLTRARETVLDELVALCGAD